MRIVETDVLVIGAGPSGLTAATLLAAQGVKALTITRYAGTAHTPRAHITNIRSIEMFRDMGIFDEIRAVSEELSFLSNNVMAVSLAGQEIARYRSYGNGSDRLTDFAEASPCKPLNAPQHVMEPVLMKAAQDRGAEIWFSNELVRIEQTPDKVIGHVVNRETGEEHQIHAKYAIGADGGRSIVAEQMGVTFEGEAGLRDMVNLWIEADVTKYTAYRPSVIFTILQPTATRGWASFGGFVCVSPWNDWIFISPGTTEIPEEKLVERVKKAIGDPDIKVRVKNISGWQVNHLYATRYKVGRVFLAGDAAHRHPPSGGLGTNTSVQDAYNLVWKLAYVLNGKAGEALLDSYHDERQPVGKFVVERAIKSLFSQDGVATALNGGAPDQAMSLDDLFSDKPGAAERREALNAAVASQNYRSNALGVELGQRYVSKVIADDGTPFPVPTRDPELYYQPTSHPGAYLPHAWVEHKRERISTLFMFEHGKFGLIVGIGGEAWRRAAGKIGAEFGVDLPVYTVGPRCEYDDVVNEWANIREIGDGGALLVRPDRHIAWRSHDLADEPEEVLRAAMRQALAR